MVLITKNQQVTLFMKILRKKISFIFCFIKKFFLNFAAQSEIAMKQFFIHSKQ